MKDDIVWTVEKKLCGCGSLDHLTFAGFKLRCVDCLAKYEIKSQPWVSKKEITKAKPVDMVKRYGVIADVHAAMKEKRDIGL